MPSEPSEPWSICRLDRQFTRRVTCSSLLYLPTGCRPGDRKWPLLLYLHGAGERGGDFELVKKHGPPKLIAAGRQFPFVVVAPQCPKEITWDIEMLVMLLDEVTATQPIDERRIYVTGLSMGGYGTWLLALHQPYRFAAIAPICGGGFPFLVDRIKHLPVWAFHGAKDDIVPLSESERMVTALQRAGADARLTVYPDAQHDAWTQTYENSELYDWLLSHQRKMDIDP